MMNKVHGMMSGQFCDVDLKERQIFVWQLNTSMILVIAKSAMTMKCEWLFMFHASVCHMSFVNNIESIYT